MSALEVSLVRVCLVLYEETSNHRVAFEAGNVEGSLKHFVPRIDLGAFVEQVLDELWVTLLHSIVETGLVIGLVDL